MNDSVRIEGGTVLIDAQEQRTDVHSVEISRNAKGEISWTVKCYGFTLEEARNDAVCEFESMEKWYQKFKQNGGNTHAGAK